MNTSSTINLGIDLGSTTFRAAYVLPDEDVVVPVPVARERVLSIFPIAEKFAINQMYCSLFFPGVVQRLQAGFPIMLGSANLEMQQVINQGVARLVQVAESYSGSRVASVLATYPAWLDSEGRTMILDAIASIDRPGHVCTDVEAAATYFRKEILGPDAHATSLICSAGYTGVGVGLQRITPKSARLLAGFGEQGLLCGNILDFMILQSTIHALRDASLIFRTLDNPRSWDLFQYRAEEAKKALAKQEEATLEIPHEFTPEAEEPLTVRICADPLRAVAREHYGQIAERIETMLQEVGLGHEAVNYVLLEGGTTHFPTVAPAFRESFPRAELHHLPPESVAGGAAWKLHLHESGSKELVEDESLFAPGPGDFFPSPESKPGLVTLPLEVAQRAAAAEPPAHAPVPEPAPTMNHMAPRPAPEPEEPEVIPVETFTLAKSRAMVEEGRVKQARALLHRLQKAVQAELEEIARL